MKALVVDDHPAIVEMLMRTLEREKFTVDTALDGNMAFEKAKTRKYDVILLDIMLPGKCGFEFISGIRALGINTPILVVSARGMVEDKIRGLDLGADDYLVKGFSLEEMMARVKNLMRRKSGKRSNIFRCGDLCLDFSNMEVLRRGKKIYLSRKEFGILLELIKRKDCIVTRKELIDLVWGEEGEKVVSNTVEAHIRLLRKKIDYPFEGERLIQTMRGYGYMLKENSKF